MIHNKYRAIAFFFLTVLLVVACNTTAPQVSQNTSSPDPKTVSIKVAAMMPRDIQHDAWSRSSYEGLKFIEKEIGAKIAYQENADVPSPQPNSTYDKFLRGFAQQNYDLIIAHGGQFMGALDAIAKEFPRIKFAVTSAYSGNNKNAAGLTYRASEGGYLAGVAAGLVTKTNKMAFLGGQPNSNALEIANFSQKGARSIKPNSNFSIEWVGSFTDENKAKKLAEELIKSGVDVMIVNVGTADPEIILMAEKAGIKAIGINQDQHSIAPQTVITSMIPKFSAIYLQAATLVLKGQWEGKQYKFGFREGAMEMAPSYGNFTPEQETKFQEIKNEIILGKLNFF
ncbi:MAG: hypothetical protein RLZZ338_1466 [Cyanobacteriota bacterium]|jgi:basic membrane protein A